MGFILKGIGTIIGIFILLAFIGAIFGSHDTSTPSESSDTKTAYTRDGNNFVSKERVEENIKYGYAKTGDYKEVKVPLNTVVVGASIFPTESSEDKEQPKFTSQPQQSQINENTQEPTKTSDDSSTADFSKLKVTEKNIKDAIGQYKDVAITYIDSNKVEVTIIVPPSISWNTESAVRRDVMDAADDFMILFSNPNVNSVYHQMNAKFTDIYGNEKVEKAIVFEMNKETANKINWEKFNDEVIMIDYKNLFRVVDYYYLHPAISKEISIS